MAFFVVANCYIKVIFKGMFVIKLSSYSCIKNKVN